MAKKKEVERVDNLSDEEFLGDLGSILKDDKEIETISANDMEPIDWEKMISTNLLPLDLALGGGICRGRLYEISGPESHGKSTLCDSIVAAWLQSNPKALCLRIESESTMDKLRCEYIGVDLKRVLLFETLVLEEGYEQIQKVQEKIYSRYGDSVPLLIVWDTLTAAATKNEAEGDTYGGGQMEAPRVNSREMKKLNFRCAEYGHSAIIIQQVREAGRDRYGNKQYDTTGGQALRHYFSARLSVKRKEPILSESNPEEIAGYVVEIKLLKNKITGATITVNCEMNLIEGFQSVGSMSRFAVEEGKAEPFIKQTGSWICAYDQNGEMYSKYQGQKKFSIALADDKYLQKLIEYAAYYNKAEEHEIFKTKYDEKIKRLYKELEKLNKERIKQKTEEENKEKLSDSPKDVEIPNLD